MAHEIESMFSVREKPWHYSMTSDVTKIIQEAPTSEEALIAAGLNWDVNSEPIYQEGNILIPGWKLNKRSTDGAQLGVVTDKYAIVQNKDAFAFTDSLLGEGCRYETAGSLRGGRTVWLLAKMPETKVVGDVVDPYICFTNSHDGSGAVRCIMTPIRVVCNNTLNAALSGFRRGWSTRHIGDISSKLAEAKSTLELANGYMKSLDEVGDVLANTFVDEEQVHEFVDKLFAVPEDASDRTRTNSDIAKSQFISCYFAPDIEKFRNTAWGVFNAAADFGTHAKPMRRTAKSDETRWSNIMNGNIVIDTTFAAMMQLAKSKKVR